MIYIPPLAIVFLAALVTTTTAMAHESFQSYDRINFQVSAIEQDRLHGPSGVANANKYRATRSSPQGCAAAPGENIAKID